jgi:hypothetical protein
MTGVDPFVLAAVAVVVLAQVPLVAYLSRSVRLDEDADRPDASTGYVTYGTREARPPTNPNPDARGDGAGRACPECGATVDASYERCGACAARLPPTGPTGGRRGRSTRGESR